MPEPALARPARNRITLGRVHLASIAQAAFFDLSSLFGSGLAPETNLLARISKTAHALLMYLGAAIPISLLYWGMASTLEWHALSPSGRAIPTCLKNSP
jgi:hypothetical protein